MRSARTDRSQSAMAALSTSRGLRCAQACYPPIREKHMDFSKFKSSDWSKVGGGLGVLIFAFVSWVKVSAGGFSDSGGNAFDFFWTGTLPWILIVGTAIVTVLLVNGTIKSGTVPWPRDHAGGHCARGAAAPPQGDLQPDRGQGVHRVLRWERRSRVRHDPRARSSASSPRSVASSASRTPAVSSAISRTSTR